MDIKLYKKQIVLDNGKKFYTFYLKLQNGSQLKISPNSYKDKEGNTHSNYNELCLIANDEMPFDR